MCQNNQIDTGDFPCELRAMLLKPIVSECIRPLDEIEREYIMGVLHAVGYNKALAAEKLNIGLATLYRKLQEYEAVGFSTTCKS
jgi:DNA-binding NtrC family response regulator